MTLDDENMINKLGKYGKFGKTAFVVVKFYKQF